MTCKNCGAQLQPGDTFCTKCGASVAASRPTYPGTGYYTPVRPEAPSRAYPDHGYYNPAPRAAARRSGRVHIGMLVTGAVMLLASFLPMIKVSFGKIVDVAAEYLGEYLGGFLGDYLDFNIADILSKLKFNIYSLISFVQRDPFDLGIPSYVKILLIAAVVFMIITIAVTISAGATRNRALSVISAVLSILCLMVCIIYIVCMGVVVNNLNQEIASYFGDFDMMVGEALRIKSIHGIGLYLFMVAAAVQSVLALMEASRR